MGKNVNRLTNGHIIQVLTIADLDEFVKFGEKICGIYEGIL